MSRFVKIEYMSWSNLLCWVFDCFDMSWLGSWGLRIAASSQGQCFVASASSVRPSFTWPGLNEQWQRCVPRLQLNACWMRRRNFMLIPNLSHRCPAYVFKTRKDVLWGPWEYVGSVRAKMPRRVYFQSQPTQVLSYGKLWTFVPFGHAIRQSHRWGGVLQWHQILLPWNQSGFVLTKGKQTLVSVKCYIFAGFCRQVSKRGILVACSKLTPFHSHPVPKTWEPADNVRTSALRMKSDCWSHPAGKAMDLVEPIWGASPHTLGHAMASIGIQRLHKMPMFHFCFILEFQMSRCALQHSHGSQATLLHGVGRWVLRSIGAKTVQGLFAHLTLVSSLQGNMS